MADIQIIVSKEVGKATVKSLTIPGKRWIENSGIDGLEYGTDIIFYVEEENVPVLIDLIKRDGLTVRLI